MDRPPPSVIAFFGAAPLLARETSVQPGLRAKDTYNSVPSAWRTQFAAHSQIASAHSARIRCACGSSPVSRTLTPSSLARCFAASSGSACTVICPER